MSQREPTIQELLESGAHFGHQTKRWNPKMKRYIFAEENKIHIIDLSKTIYQLKKAVAAAKAIVGSHKSVLFVGTKKQAKDVVRSSAEACGEFYVSERWLGGMLTNLTTIRKSVKKLENLEKKLSNENLELTKKEKILLSKEQVKLDRNLSGIRALRKAPGLLIVVDPTLEDIAVLEAKKLNIPVMAIVDTNCDPSLIDYPIPANDDAQKSIKLILEAIVAGIQETKELVGPDLVRAEEKEERSTQEKATRARRPKKEMTEAIT